MDSFVVKAHVGQDGVLTLELPQFRDIEVEVVIREVQSTNQLAIFDIPSLQLPADHSAHTFLNREDLYDDNER